MRHRKPRFFTLALFLGASAIFILIFLNANPAYAIGSIKITTYNDLLDIKFVSASTDDPGTGIDPGQDVHVGQCTARLNGKRVNLKVYNSYPDYQCTLSVRLKNLSKQTVRLQRVETKIPEEIVIARPTLPAELVLKPEEETAIEFILRINQNVEENTKYRFSIQLIFENANR